MKNFFSTLNRFVLSPVSDYLSWTLLFFLLLWIQDISTTEFCSWKSYIARPLWFAIYDGWMAYFLSFAILVATCWNNVVRKALLGLVSLLIMFFCAASIVLCHRIGQGWNGNTITVILGTNLSEMEGFFLTYVLHLSSFVCLAVFVLCIAGYVALMKYLKRWTDFWEMVLFRWVQRFVAYGALMLSFMWLPAYGLDLERNSDFNLFMLFRPQFYQAYQSTVGVSMNKEYCDMCLRNQQNTEATCVETDSCHVVLVLGESFIKRHSSLYGYGLETNPYLSRVDSLVCFENVTSSSNLTYQAFTNIMSMSSVDDSLHWYDAPMFPVLFRKAGYNSIYYTNQFARSEGFNLVRSVAGFVDRQDIMGSCFNYINDHVFPNDFQFMEEYDDLCLPKEQGRLRLTVVHLYGQHFAFKDKFPADRARFKVKDIDRPDLNDSQRQVVADYDNATLFNDSVVFHILDRYKDENMVFVYLSDHGEEVYDIRDVCGRTFDFDKMPADAIRSQIDVPFFVYASPRYRLSHPNLWRRIQNSRLRKFQSDDLPHMLLHLGGISTTWYDEVRDPLSDNYNEDRKRTFNEGYAYPSLQ